MVKHDKIKMVTEQVLDYEAQEETIKYRGVGNVSYPEAEPPPEADDGDVQKENPRFGAWPKSNGRIVRPARTLSSTFGDDVDLAHDLPANWTLKRFQDDVKEILDQYLLFKDITGTVQRTKDLLKVCPSTDEYGVIAIRKAVDSNEAIGLLIVNLLCALNSNGVIDVAGFVRSFEKLFCTWEDIMIDAPRAPSCILRTLEGLCNGGVACQALFTKIPEGLLKLGLQEEEQTDTQLGETLRGVAADLKKFKLQLTPCLEEYFVALNDEEVEIFLRELNMTDYHHEFVKKAATQSFSASNVGNARGAIIKLFTHLSNNGCLTKDDLQWGLSRLLGQLDDLALDCPHAMDYTTELLCAMVSDELVSVPFLRRCSLLRIGGSSGLQVLKQTQRRTPRTHSKRYLDTMQFKKELQTMIEEYFNSGDVAEFTQCVRDLAPWSEAQSAELVRKLMTYAMEQSGTECEMALQLLIKLHHSEEVSLRAVERGFDELYARMPDLVLDVPDAREMARTFVMEAQLAELLHSDWQPPKPSE
mmetsp:Transcript_54537/g.100939  ORF Transcript_54537/g.100939 Transcript_54537/m.100939 type:complete len:529 (-) Transcript_54537:96-1682(-)